MSESAAQNPTRTRRTAAALAAALVVLLFAAPDARTSGPQASHQPARKTTLVNGREAMAGEALVKFRTPAVAADVEAVLDTDEDEGVGGRGVRRVHSRSLGTAALVAALSARPDVEYAEPNYIVTADVMPNDYYFSLMWGLVNSGQTIGGLPGTAGADISADQAWGLTVGSTANVVAVIDTGIDYNHPDLAGNVWSAPSSFTVTIGGQTITCAAGTHGFNAITKTCNPMDDQNHGTHTSGTIGAVGNNGIGVTGVNWVASIMGAKFLDSTGSGTTANAINSIAFVIQAKQRFGSAANVRVLSNSWGGGDYSQALRDEISLAADNGMLFVAAAGNEGSDNDSTPSFPANYALPNVLSVAATDNRDALASFSNYGASKVHLGAPGVYVASTIRNGGYAYMSGTSMATPHVAGAAALVLSYCPSLTTAQLVTTILNSVDPASSLAGKTTTGGRLNVYKALTSCASPAPVTPVTLVSVSATPASPMAVGTPVTWTAVATGGTEPLQYQFSLYNEGTSTWSVLQGYAAGSSVSWTPTEPGSYHVQVLVRSAGSTLAYEAWKNSTPFTVLGVTPVTIASVSATPAGTVAVGTPVTWTAVAAGGAPPLQYQFSLYNRDTSTWSLLQAYAASSSVSWTPTQAGSYHVQVLARSSGSTEYYEAWRNSTPLTVAGSLAPVTVASVSAAPAGPVPAGTSVTWMAVATGGVAPLQYQFWLYSHGTATWSLLQDYAASSSASWTPTTAGAYHVQVWVRSAGSTASYEAWRNSTLLSVVGSIAPVAITSITSTAVSPVPQGTPVTWTAVAAGGVAPLEYAFIYCDEDTGVVGSLAGYTPDNSVTWSTPWTGSYHVQAWVRSAGSTASYEAWRNSATFVVAARQ